MTERLPANFDRAALERIIRRATELQTGEHDVGDELSTEEVLALGKEVGISERHLRQAVLEESNRPMVVQAEGWLDRLSGSAVVSAERVVAGDGDGVESALLRHMEQEELLRLQRQKAGRIAWEQMTGWQATVKRSVSGGRPYHLQHADLITATLTPLETGYLHVSLVASLRQNRAQYLGFGFGMASLTVAGAAVLFALGAFPLVALAPLPLGAGLLVGVSRQFRPVAQRTQLGLEIILDHLERGVAKPSHQLPPRATGLLEVIATEVRRALEPARKPK
jgi:hypothetical protein